MKRLGSRDFLLVVTFCCLAVGCAPALHVPLKAEHAMNIGSTRVFTSIPQDEVTAVVEPSHLSAGVGGGLLFALIDAAVNSSRTSTANKLIEPIRKEVSDFDFRTAFFDSLEITLRGIAMIQIAKMDSTAKPLSEKERAALRKQIPENGLLSVSTTYELSSNFQSLYVVTLVSLWLRNQEEPVYLSRYHYYTPPIAASNERETAASAWAANRGAVLRVALKEGISETMKMIQLDFRPSPVPISAPVETPKFSDGAVITGASPSSLTYLAKNDKRYIVRHRDILYSASTEERFVPSASYQ
jgi:hypothetical protein